MQKALKTLEFANIYKNAAVAGGASLPDSFWINFVQMSQRLGVDPYELAAVINNESGFRPHAQNKQGGRIVAQGLNQLIKSTATKMLGMSEELWENFSKLPPEEHLKWTEKYFRKIGPKVKGKGAGDLYLMNFGGYKNPDGSLYASLEAQERFKRQNPGTVFKNPQYQQKAVEQNPGLVDSYGRIMPQTIKSKVAGGPPSGIRAKIDEAIRKIGNRAPPPYQEPNPNWTATQPVKQYQRPQAPQAPRNKPIQRNQKPPDFVNPGYLSNIENKLWF